MPSVAPGHHLAAILPSKGARLEVTERPTPAPGPNELLIEVKSIALNGVDGFQRKAGFMLTHYPAVLGSDVAGIVLSVGSAVNAEDLKPGTRVAAFATAFFAKGDPDYGAFQTRVIVPAANAVPLPPFIDFNEASLLPMAVATAWAGLYSIGVPYDTKYTDADRKALLVWGGGGSIGSAAVQVAKLLGFIVYATASAKHHEHLKTLGASRLFDYKDENVIEQIVQAAEDDGLTIPIVYDGVPGGQLTKDVEVLEKLRGAEIGRVAFAAPLPPDFQQPDGIEVKFAMGPTEEKARNEHFRFIFNVWLKEKLASKEFVPVQRFSWFPEVWKQLMVC